MRSSTGDASSGGFDFGDAAKKSEKKEESEKKEKKDAKTAPSPGVFGGFVCFASYHRDDREMPYLQLNAVKKQL